MRLILPDDSAFVRNDSAFTVAWGSSDRAAFYRLEFRDETGRVILEALLPRTVRYYRVAGGALNASGSIRWRVAALDATGDLQFTSGWRTVRTSATNRP
jgi:hypothetical protein